MKSLWSWLRQPKHGIPILIVLVLAIYGGYKWQKQKAAKPQYQTTAAEKGTLINSVSASGNITTGNNLVIATAVTGTVQDLAVQNGDKVIAGQRIATIQLDQDSKQRQAAAFASYLAAKNNLAQAQATLYSLQSKEFAANQIFINGAVARNLANSDPTYIQQQADWLAAEAAYKNQAGVIAQAQAAVTSAWLNYQQLASIVTAPKSGIINNLTIAPGSVLVASTTGANNSNSLQQLGTITDPKGKTQALVELTEVDAPNVAPGQKVTLTLDAFPDKTFTGKILTVNTNGQVSSNVTTYPATIVFDTATDKMYPNMAVAAKIITNIKDNVILVPSGAITTSNGQSTVKVLKNGQVTTVNVEIGGSNDTQTEITTGINEGDQVVTGTTTASNSQQTTTTSPFSAFGNRGFGGAGGGGAAIRRVGGD